MLHLVWVISTSSTPQPRRCNVARHNLRNETNCSFHLRSVDDLPLPDASFDLIYSLGVLHHVPDTAGAINDCVKKLKPGGTFLVYLYYAFDNRPAWFQIMWRMSDALRRIISTLPFRSKRFITDLLALVVYLPFARLASLAGRIGIETANFPLSSYAGCSFYTMRTDSLDRFGTRLEQRFTRTQIERMLAGFRAG